MRGVYKVSRGEFVFQKALSDADRCNLNIVYSHCTSQYFIGRVRFRTKGELDS